MEVKYNILINFQAVIKTTHPLFICGAEQKTKLFRKVAKTGSY